MRENIITHQELKEMWARPPERQISVAQAKIMEAIAVSKGRVQISWSGGKDSTFLLYLYCMVVRDIPKYKNEHINVVFADTTNESRGIYRFIKYYPQWLEGQFGVKINLSVVKPTLKNKPTTMVEVVKQFGVPFISKETAGRIVTIRNSMNKNNVSFAQIENHLSPTLENVDYLLGLGLNRSTLRFLNGWLARKDNFGRYKIAQKWIPLLKDAAPLISDQCCYYLKKRPLSQLKYDGVYMHGTMAEESELRKQTYLTTGCNGAIKANGTGTSTPMGAMTEQALLFGIKHYGVPIAEDYGDVIEVDGCLKCSGEQRTGCILCGFGIGFDRRRFVRLQKIEHAKIKYAFTPKEQGGLGYLEACEYINKYCNAGIEIPVV